MSEERSPQELIKELYELFSTFKKRIEDPSYIQIENTLTQLMQNQIEMKEEIRELKKHLLNPFDGVIIETKKTSAEIENLLDWKSEIETVIEEHKGLMRWKVNVQKILIAILTASGAVISFFLSKYFGV